MNLSDCTTFRLGGPAEHVTTASTEEELIAFCRSHPLRADGPQAPHRPDVLLIAGGSNLLIGDEGFAGPVCLIRTSGIEWDAAEAGSGEQAESAGRVVGSGAAEAGSSAAVSSPSVRVTAAAGEDWDGFVAQTIARGLSGLEALSGIPGSVGATPVQNVGAYGAEVADALVSVRALDRVTGEILELSADDLGFGYRDSLLKRAAAEHAAVRYVVLSVTFELAASADSAPIRYGQLANALGAEIGDRVPAAQVRDSVIALRASKGMVLDADDHDTWSAGSFFTNPILPAGSPLPDGAPTYPVRTAGSGDIDTSLVKTSAAWLIEHAGFGKGFSAGSEAASLSTKHTLALTHRGGGSTADVLALATAVVDGVEEAFGIRLEPEPNLIGCALP